MPGSKKYGYYDSRSFVSFQACKHLCQGNVKVLKPKKKECEGQGIAVYLKKV